MKRRRKATANAELRKAISAANKDKHERAFRFACTIAGLPQPSKEISFHPGRKWRFDFAWVDKKLAVEINGGGGRGRHNSVIGATKDAEKMNAAIVLGWRVLVFTVVSIRDTAVVADTIKAAYSQENA